MENIREVIHTRDQAIDNLRFDDVFPFPPKEFLVEYLLENRRPHLHRSLQSLAVGGFAHCNSVYIALGIVSVVQSQSRAQRPSMKL